MARGINCDVWIAQRTDWPTPNSKNSTWEWYFAVVCTLFKDIMLILYCLHCFSEFQPSFITIRQQFYLQNSINKTANIYVFNSVMCYNKTYHKPNQFDVI